MTMPTTMMMMMMMTIMTIDDDYHDYDGSSPSLDLLPSRSSSIQVLMTILLMRTMLMTLMMTIPRNSLSQILMNFISNVI